MRLIDIITIRKNKFNEDRKNPSFTDFWQGYHEGWYNAYKDLEEILEQKGFDAVHVVRCRECKYNNSPDCPMVYEEYFFDEDDGGVTYVIDNAVDPEGFCSYGERKDGDA